MNLVRDASGQYTAVIPADTSRRDPMTACTGAAVALSDEVIQAFARGGAAERESDVAALALGRAIFAAMGKPGTYTGASAWPWELAVNAELGAVVDQICEAIGEGPQGRTAGELVAILTRQRDDLALVAGEAADLLDLASRDLDAELGEPCQDMAARLRGRPAAQKNG